MIPVPNRPAASARTGSTMRAPPADAPIPSDASEPDTTSPLPAPAQPALDAPIAALVARASTPQDEALEKQREEFDYIARVEAETQREINALRDMAMEQIKQDDELLKKWIALI